MVKTFQQIDFELTAYIVGLPFCVQDYTNGVAYGDKVTGAELMIGRTHTDTGTPVLRFSLPPRRFEADDCVDFIKMGI